MSRSLSVEVASDDLLDVRQFSVHERISSLFEIDLVVLCENPNIDFDAVVGQPATFRVDSGLPGPAGGLRIWQGICNRFQQSAVEEKGASTYSVSIVPALWLGTQRRNYRIFQQVSEPDIVLQILSELAIEPVLRIDAGAYKTRKYRVQYGESDYDFICRMLEDVGISFYFIHDGSATKLVLDDAPQDNEVRPEKIPFTDNPTDLNMGDRVTAARIVQQVRPGRYTMRDHDYRRPPDYKLLAEARGRNVAVEDKLERFHYVPGAFLFGADQGDATPAADDRGMTRTDESEAAVLAQKRLEAKRSSARVCTFETSAHDLAPGVVMGISNHPHALLGEDKKLLVYEAAFSGTHEGDWQHSCEVRSAELPFRPPMSTPKPKAQGVESATVVGPPGEEIHTDEFGRVRVHFHWDRYGSMDDKSSCWIHVSQPWGGAGYGGTNLPRIGQEVLVDFLGGDPDRPVIIGRYYTALQKPPYKLPDSKTRSGWRSNSSPGGGGYNELMMDDTAGKELVNLQAQKDLTKLVKNNEDMVIGNCRSKQVAVNESNKIGASQTNVIGVNKTTNVGSVLTTSVGDKLSIRVGKKSSTQDMTEDTIVLNTGAGAKITMDGAEIKLEAETIGLWAKKALYATSMGSAALAGYTELLVGSGKGVTKIRGKAGIDISSGSTVSISGGPMVLINPTGSLFAGRVTELAPATITTGAATVCIGGPSFPLPVVRLPDGTLQIGDHLFIKPGEGRYPDFQSRVLRDLGIMSTTPAGLDRLNNINNNPNGANVTIREYTADEAADYGENNSLAYRHGAGALLGYDADGNPVPGSGADSTIAYNPDIELGPDGSPEPPDAILFHEMGHAEHNAWGTNRADENMGGGWHNQEEYQTIEQGTNTSGSDIDIPGVPDSPTENDYLDDRDYPYRRTDHDSGYSNPDGSPISP